MSCLFRYEFGWLYDFVYPTTQEMRPGEGVPVSTTRPETIPGDTGLAVHPEDKRYKVMCRLYS